ncbi:MAG TPA: pacearchaeosortase [Candidatus Nanoarchaeia archaeon]|nr:pacearchaeosortase [Candidatus Nanoarchaeia archaeon]
MTQVKSVLHRYGILALLIGVGMLFVAPSEIFRRIFGPITINIVYALLHVFGDANMVSSSVISLSDSLIELAPACIAGSAYFLLTILNMSTPMALKTRIYSLAYLYGAFLVLNIVRIVFFSYAFVKGMPLFDFLHLATWYIGSTIMVIGIWFSYTFLFKISAFPLYSDITALVSRKR